MTLPYAPDNVVSVLSTTASPEDTAKAIRFIKNSIIGNKTKKELYLSLGVAPALVNILRDSPDKELKIQVAVVLGSFAYGSEDSIDTVITAGAIPPLLSALSSKDAKFIEASARALKAIFQTHRAPRSDVFKDTCIVDLISLLSCESPLIGNTLPSSPPSSVSSSGPDSMNPATHSSLFNQPTSTTALSSSSSCSSLSSSSSIQLRISEVAASILAKVAVTPDEQNAIISGGAIPFLIRLLDSWTSSYTKVREAALDCLGALCRENVRGCKAILESKTENDEKAVSLLFKLVKDKRPVTRLLASACLTNMCRTGTLPSPLAADMTLTVLPTLIKLFSDTTPISSFSNPVPPDLIHNLSSQSTVCERAHLVFATLVSDSEDLQRAAMQIDAVTKLSTVLTSTSLGKENDRIKESALLGIAAVCSLREECRKQVIDAKILPIVVESMQSSDVGVRAAACMCTRSLSRSVKNLRTSLVDAGVALPLFKLLSDPSITVQTTASATLCNIVLDFSPMKKTVLENGGVERLVKLVGSTDSNLRLNSVWALKNLLFQADSDVKGRVMRELGWETLYRLTGDSDMAIQEQALNLLRNLACGKEADIEACFTGLSPTRLLSIIEHHLQSSNEDIALQTLYILVNVATGGERHKNIVMTNHVLDRVGAFMTHPRPHIRVAAIWVIINLTWPEDSGSSDRVSKLRALGFESVLRSLEEDISLDVKDRVRTALGHFGVMVMGSTGGSMGVGSGSGSGGVVGGFEFRSGDDSIGGGGGGSGGGSGSGSEMTGVIVSNPNLSRRGMSGDDTDF